MRRMETCNAFRYAGTLFLTMSWQLTPISNVGLWECNCLNISASLKIEEYFAIFASSHLLTINLHCCHALLSPCRKIFWKLFLDNKMQFSHTSDWSRFLANKLKIYIVFIYKRLHKVHRHTWSGTGTNINWSLG